MFFFVFAAVTHRVYSESLFIFSRLNIGFLNNTQNTRCAFVYVIVKPGIVSEIVELNEFYVNCCACVYNNKYTNVIWAFMNWRTDTQILCAESFQYFILIYLFIYLFSSFFFWFLCNSCVQLYKPNTQHQPLVCLATFFVVFVSNSIHFFVQFSIGTANQ